MNGLRPALAATLLALAVTGLLAACQELARSVLR